MNRTKKIFSAMFLILCLSEKINAQPDCTPGTTYPFIFCPGGVQCSSHPCNDPTYGKAVKATLPGCINISGIPGGDMVKQPTQSAPGPDPDPEPPAPGADPCGTAPTPKYDNNGDITQAWQDWDDCETGADGTTTHADWQVKKDAFDAWQSDHQAHTDCVNQQNDAEYSAITVFDPSQAYTDAQNALNAWISSCPGLESDATCCINIIFDPNPQDFTGPSTEGSTTILACPPTACASRFIHVNISNQRLWSDPDFSNNQPNTNYIDPSTDEVRDFPGIMFYTGNSVPIGQAFGYHTTSFLRLMEHEMGHWLGFSHIDKYGCSGSDDQSIMWSTGITKDKDPEPLHSADKCMFEMLYCGPDCTSGVASKSQSLPLEIIVHPNPSTGASQVFYTLDKDCRVQISIYDLLGKEIINVYSGEQAEGDHSISLHTQYLASGTYTCKVIAGNNIAIAKFIVVQK